MRHWLTRSFGTGTRIAANGPLGLSSADGKSLSVLTAKSAKYEAPDPCHGESASKLTLRRLAVLEREADICSTY